MLNVGLIFGGLTADHYEDKIAADPRIDELRAKMTVTEDQQYSKDYLDPGKRSIANAVQVFFDDGRKTDKIAVEYPIGHRRRREQGLPLLVEKFKTNLRRRIPTEQQEKILALSLDRPRLESTPVSEYVDLYVI